MKQEEIVLDLRYLIECKYKESSFWLCG